MLEKEELGHPARSLLRQLRQNLPLFSPAEQLIGEFVLARPRQVLRLPTDQLAKEIESAREHSRILARRWATTVSKHFDLIWQRK